MSMTVKPTQGGRIVIDVKRAQRFLEVAVVGAIVDNVHNGRDIHGKPLAQYRPSYKKQLAAMGEDSKVDLRLTGGMLASVRMLRIRIDTKGAIAFIFGPGTGTSAQVAPPPKGKGRVAHRTGRRGPAHNILGYWIHHGAGRLVARPWLGLAPKYRERINKALVKLLVTKR